LAVPLVPEPTRRRCDRVLFTLRLMAPGQAIRANELSEQIRRGGLHDYSAQLCRKDLRRLDKVGLVLSDYGHPERFWTR
jgi:hypothetical protein